MRLIDADELVAELIYLYEDRGWHEREIHFSLADMRCNVDMIPTVDSVKHGHWVRSNSDYEWECSSCGYGYTDYRLTYCYDCGAIMDGEGEEDADE